MGGWSWARVSSRESLPSFERPAPLAARSQSSGVLLGRGGRAAPCRGPRPPPLDVAALTADGGDAHRYAGVPPAGPERAVSRDGSQWPGRLVRASCSRHSLAPGGELRSQPPRSRSFACPPRPARPRQKAAHYVSAALSDDLSAAYRGDPRDICPQYERSFATCDR